MSRKITNSEAISNLNHIYGIVSPDIQRSLDVAIKSLEERPQGEWIKRTEKNGYYWYECNLCGCLPYYARSITTIKFCPNCGAEMREAENDI